MSIEIGNSEGVVEALVAKLQAELPARIEAINEAATDGMVLGVPQDYFTGRVAEFPRPPAIFVLEGVTAYDRGAEGGHSLLTQLDLFVYVGDSDQTGPLLARRLQRMKRAVIGAVWNGTPRAQLLHPATGELVSHTIRPRRSIPGTVFEPTMEHTWRGFYAVIFRAEQSES